MKLLNSKLFVTRNGLFPSMKLAQNVWDSNAIQTSCTVTCNHVWNLCGFWMLMFWGVYLGNLAPRMSFWPYFLQLKPSSGVASKFASGTRNFAVHLGSPFLYGSWPRKWGARCSVQIVLLFFHWLANADVWLSVYAYDHKNAILFFTKQPSPMSLGRMLPIYSSL